MSKELRANRFLIQLFSVFHLKPLFLWVIVFMSVSVCSLLVDRICQLGCVCVSDVECVCVRLAAWPHLFGVMPMVGTAPADFEKLTRCLSVKLHPVVQCLVEAAALAVGHVVGHDNIKSRT